MALSAAWRERIAIARTVAPAVALAYALDIALTDTTLRQSLGLLGAYVLLFVTYFFIGRWFGKYTWTKRGKAFSRWVLKRRVRKEKAFLFLSDRPDRTFTTLQRVWEVVGFAAGTTVIITTIPQLVGASVPFATTIALLLPIVATWAAFFLVPYWLFARLGFRIVEPVRWLILPLSRRYADRLKLSNGALALIALGAVFNVTFRAGAPGGAAVEEAIVLVLRNVAVVVVIAATAVAYYNREERRIAHELELESLQFGIRDGRGMSDGDFLPRLPKPKA